MPQGGRHDDARSWSPEEDQRLLQLHSDMPGRWKEVSRLMGEVNPRTPAMVRNRYLRIMKGRAMAHDGTARNKCGKCGAIKRGHVCTVTSAPVATCSATEQAERHREARAAMEATGGLTLAAPALEAASEFPVATAVIVSSSPAGASAPAGAEPAATPLSSSGFQQDQALFAPLAESSVSPAEDAENTSLDVSPVSVSPVMLAEMIKLATQEDTPTGFRGVLVDTTPLVLSGEQ